MQIYAHSDTASICYISVFYIFPVGWGQVMVGSAAPILSGPARCMSKPKLTEVVGLAYTFGNSVSPDTKMS